MDSARCPPEVYAAPIEPGYDKNTTLGNVRADGPTDIVVHVDPALAYVVRTN